MTIEVTLAIDPTVASADRTAITVADQLVQMGGAMVRWQSNTNGTPAKATFKFKNHARCDRFVADALAIPGVSLAAL